MLRRLRHSNILKYASIASLISASFIYGVSVGAYKVFPYNLLKNAKAKITGSEPLPLHKRLKCEIPQVQNVSPDSVVIVGHAYSGSQDFINPSLERFLKTQSKNIDHVFFTGDVLGRPSQSKWENLKAFFTTESLDFSIIPGNHDVGFGDNALRDIFTSQFEFSHMKPITFRAADATFILEDSTLLDGKLSQESISTLNQNYDGEHKLILLRHHIPVTELLYSANRLSGYADDLHAIVELERQITQNLTIIAGDGGQNSKLSGSECAQFGKIKIIVNGLGNVARDEVLIIHSGQIGRYKIGQNRKASD